MLLHLWSLLHLWPNVITLVTFITFVTSYYICAFNKSEKFTGILKMVQLNPVPVFGAKKKNKYQYHLTEIFPRNSRANAERSIALVCAIHKGIPNCTWDVYMYSVSACHEMWTNIERKRHIVNLCVAQKRYYRDSKYNFTEQMWKLMREWCCKWWAQPYCLCHYVMFNRFMSYTMVFSISRILFRCCWPSIFTEFWKNCITHSAMKKYHINDKNKGMCI